MIRDDESLLLAEAAQELGVEPPTASRRFVSVGGSQRVSLPAWGSGAPELVFLHGGGENAHTWDSLLLRLGRPAVAIDLPGHGHSDWRPDRDHLPVRSAAAVATVVSEVAPGAAAVIGMSLGGLVLLVDVSPGSREAVAAMGAAQRGAVALTSGPRVFATREEMVDAGHAVQSDRPEASAGLIHDFVVA